MHTISHHLQRYQGSHVTVLHETVPPEAGEKQDMNSYELHKVHLEITYDDDTDDDDEDDVVISALVFCFST